MTPRLYVDDYCFAGFDELIGTSAFRRDGKAVAAVPDETFIQAMDRIDADAGFVGPVRLKEIVSEVVHDDEQARGLSNFIYNIQSLRRHARKDDAASLAREFTESLQKASVPDGGLTADEVARLAHRLPRIAAPKTSMDRQAKAVGVARRVGLALDKIALACDLRPVFDDSRDNVEAMIPLTLMRVVARGPEGFPQTLEVTLTEKQLLDLNTEVERARTKLATLKRFVEKTAVPIPESPMTVIGEPS